MKYKKNRYNKYDMGSWVKPMGPKGSAIAGGAADLVGMVGGAIGGPTGNVVSGIGAGAAAGAALGPIGMGVGALIGAGTSLLGNKKAKEAAEGKRRDDYNVMSQGYKDQFESNYDTDNENAYGNQIYENGGMIDPTKKSKQDTIYTKKGNMVTTSDMVNLKKNGLGFDSMQAYGYYLDTWASPVTASGFSNPQSNKTFNQIKPATTPYQYDSPAYSIPKQRYATGGEVIPSVINIEKGELQIDPESGKILREYDGVNPETGGLYEPHSKKGKDTKNNLVNAEEGTFIITKKKAKDYKKAIDENDKIKRDTILQNINNYKTREGRTEKMATGGFPKPSYLFAPGEQTNNPDLFNPRIAPNSPMAKMSTSISPVSVGTAPTGSFDWAGKLQGAGDTLAKYGPSLLNIGKGIFGDVDQTSHISPTINPYKSQILNNLPKDMDFEPIRQQALRQQNTAFNQIDNSTLGSPVARANKTNVFANTQNQLGQLQMQNNINNNQIRSQRAGIYSNLGNQEVNEINRTQGVNFGIDEQNRANRAAKSNLLNEGVSQLQQTYLNDKTNKRKAELDEYQVGLLKQIFPSITPYFDTMFNPNKKKG